MNASCVSSSAGDQTFESKPADDHKFACTIWITS